jgi:hypothetical protein
MTSKHFVVILLVVFTRMSNVESPATNILSSNNIEVNITVTTIPRAGECKKLKIWLFSSHSTHNAHAKACCVSLLISYIFCILRLLL